MTDVQRLISILEAIESRLVRTETRLIKLMGHVGLDARGDPVRFTSPNFPRLEKS